MVNVMTWSNKFGSKNFGSKIFGFKHFGSKKVGPKKNLGPINSGPKILGQNIPVKKFWAQKKFWSNCNIWPWEPSWLFDGSLGWFIISRLRVRQDLEFRKSKTEKISAFDSRSWELRTHPRTPLSHQNKPWQCAGLWCWARAPPQGNQGTQLSLLNLLRKTEHTLSNVRFYWDE